MHRPCENCPFRVDLQPPFPLGFDRRVQIARSLLADAQFGCHKTTTFDDAGNYYWTERERPCIGAARFIEKELGDCRANFAFRLAVAYKKLNPEQIDRSIPVLDTFETFTEAEE